MKGGFMVNAGCGGRIDVFIINAGCGGRLEKINAGCGPQTK